MRYHVPLTEGHLEVNPPARLMASACVRGVSGTLTLSRHRAVKQVHFHKGRIIGASSNQPSESLGTFLVCQGLITTEAYANSLAHMDRSDKRHGEILVEIGAISKEKLPEALRLQHLNRLIDVVSWSRGRYHFKNDTPAATQNEFSLWLLLQASVKKHFTRDELKKTAKKFADDIVVYKKSVLEPLLVEDVRMFELFGNMDNKSSVRQLSIQSRLPKLTFINLLILRELGVIEFKRSALPIAA